MIRLRVDLNCDLGESFGTYASGHDNEMMASISSANVACGVHVGDLSVMRRTVRLALEHGVSIGAHPGFADRVGFGRRPMPISPDAVENLILYQLSALAKIVSAHGRRLSHIKPHGALYNMASVDRSLANAVARASQCFDPSIVLYGLSGSCLLESGLALGLKVASEVFADRAYHSDGTLVSRTEPGALITEPEVVVERAVRMVTEGRTVAIDGSSINLQAETICVHGDTVGAAELVGYLRNGLESAGVVISRVDQDLDC